MQSERYGQQKVCRPPPSPVGAAYLYQIMLRICRPYGAWPARHNECYKHIAPTGLGGSLQTCRYYQKGAMVLSGKV
ncbi:hypothetical protein [Desulfonema magnum]|uniref:Uncharacterized protein n=1 Tax=Desulfonema magnum TaxID=45655 RepID=A0A975GRA8_9BACT|nr:hypothetical protein [Desulfonema magnum]QTA90851.1 Uncharacterized protein dnm_069130 [Desulfonema magnum]